MKLSSTRKKIILSVIIGASLIFSLNFFQKEVKGFFYSISWPIQKTLWQARDITSDFLEAISRAKDLKRQNEELKLKLQELLAENSSLKDLKKENQLLRETLELGLQKEFRLELAEIIGKDINRDSILVNKGLRDSISKDSPVITSQKVLLGRTIEIYDNFSRVMLISDKESSFEAKIADSDVGGMVKGRGAFELKMTFIPRNEEIKEGDLVVSSSLSGVYPKNLLVGLIKEVKRFDVNPFQEAEISSLSDISNLEEVFIILNF